MSDGSGKFVIPAKAVAGASTLASIGLLATLAVVVSVQNIDVLSTVALALAIMAFVVQLIVYIIQSISAAQQLQNAQKLHGDMMEVLRGIQEKSTALERTVQLLHDQVIEEFRGKARSERQLGRSSSTELAAIEDSLAALEAPVSLQADRSMTIDPLSVDRQSDQYPPALPVPEAEKMRAELLSWPGPDDYDEVREAWNELPPTMRQSFFVDLRDLLSATNNKHFGPGLSLDPETSPIRKAGLVDKVKGWRLQTPSEKGRRIGRLLTAEGPAPDGFPEDLLRLREEIRDAEEASRARMRNRRD
ncbi:hypothetical protein [Rhodococcus sp. NPDC057529]|uniref:hypothetical protein n=1 Tax=Rhodococcus sp. NPDC057529 TaxID=3346158 RepID=UPI00366CAE70